jgi:raffinose/stachyose/melibiose transport system substrate-binding protein
MNPEAIIINLEGETLQKSRFLAFFLILALCTGLTASTGLGAGKVTLTLGSWRVDDVESIGRLLKAFSKHNPNIVIKFNPTNPPDYNAVLRTRLSGGTGPDLMYLRSFKTSADLYRDGFLAPLTGLKGLKTHYSEGNLSPWTNDQGVIYGLPFAAVSHGVYYNSDLFKKYKLRVPQTWPELIAAAKTLKAAGVTPFANGSKDQWDMNEIVLMNLLPGFIGGRAARLEYETGKVPFNDAKMVAVFQAIKEIAPYLPAGQEGISYYDSQQLFLLGKAAMFFGGSWDVSMFEKAGPGFAWNVFATPAPAGRKTVVCFHPDCGIGINKASKHQKEARIFLRWLMTKEAAQIVANELTGFFALTKAGANLHIKSKHATAFLAISRGKETDLRFVWPRLMDPPSGKTSGYNLTQDAALAVAKGSMTPRQAADSLQAGLSEWFAPARRFKK